MKGPRWGVTKLTLQGKQDSELEPIKPSIHVDVLLEDKLDKFREPSTPVAQRNHTIWLLKYYSRGGDMHYCFMYPWSKLDEEPKNLGDLLFGDKDDKDRDLLHFALAVNYSWPQGARQREGHYYRCG